MATSKDLQVSDISKLKVADLKRELKARGLSTSGYKNDLTERLLSALQTNALEEDEDVLEDDVLADDGKASDVSFQDEIILNSPTATESPTKLGIATEKIIIDDKIDDLNTNNNNSQDEKVLMTKLQGVSDDEKKILRAKKFELPMSDDLKKQARAERFGTGETIKTSNSAFSSDLDRLQKRAERFKLDKTEEILKLNARAKRFQLENEPLVNIPTNDALKKRKERFGIVTKTEEIEAKKKKRAARFGTD